MKKYLFIGFLSVLSATKVFAQVGHLVVNLSGLQTNNGGGEVELFVYTKENMHKVGKELFRITKDVTGSQMQIVVDNVPAGSYGVTCFQDLDRDKKLKTNFLGMPKEPIGISNNPKVRFGPPSFERAKITIEPNKTLSIDIILR